MALMSEGISCSEMKQHGEFVEPLLPVSGEFHVHASTLSHVIIVDGDDGSNCITATRK